MVVVFYQAIDPSGLGHAVRAEEEAEAEEPTDEMMMMTPTHILLVVWLFAPFVHRPIDRSTRSTHTLTRTHTQHALRSARQRAKIVI